VTSWLVDKSALVRLAARLSLLHLDKAFDLIAEITGQPLERLTVE
jgi:hypothetical protein